MGGFGLTPPWGLSEPKAIRYHLVFRQIKSLKVVPRAADGQAERQLQLRRIGCLEAESENRHGLCQLFRLVRCFIVLVAGLLRRVRPLLGEVKKGFHFLFQVDVVDYAAACAAQLDGGEV